MPSFNRLLFIIVAALSASVLPAVALSAPSAAQPSPGVRSADANALVDAIARTDQLSGVALVAMNDEVLFKRPFGFANLEWDIANVPEGKFRLGSLTKQFTAAAILQLQEAGKLSVDDPVSKYYTDAPASWKDVTIKHLLTHTSGIHNYTSMDRFFAKEARLDRTPKEIIELTRDQPLDFPPGSQFRYDNSAYVLLGYIVEKVSGERYQDYLQNHIFKPLGMTSSGYDDSAEILHHRTYGYDRTKTGLKNQRFSI
jgi:CubicO group peptidase (beta-lactamase class C family)